MKILIASDVYHSQINGVVTSIDILMKELETDGHEVRILTLSDNLKSYIDGNIYYNSSVSAIIYPNMRMFPRLNRTIHKDILNWKPDLIHTQSEFSVFHFARLIAKQLNIPIVHTYHTLYQYYVGYLLPVKRIGDYVTKMYFHNILNKSDCVIAPTKKVKEYLDHYNIDSEIKIVPTGIVRELPKQISESRKMELMEAYHIDPNKKILLSVGRLGTEKNLDELLMNMGDLVKLRDDVQMIIVGDGPYRKELEAMVKTMGLGEHILFTGMIAHDEINEIYQLGDLFVSASTSETQGLTVLEAMMNGLPLVCREDKSIDNVLVERVNGYTYKDRFVAVDCMNKLLSEPELHKAFSEDSKKIAKTFSTESFAKKISDIYKQASLLYNVS